MKNMDNSTATSVTIEEELKTAYLGYAMSVIIGRALPDVRDGLKPVHRRVLFAMHELGNDWNKPYKKSARIVGDVIGKYHPHGDSAVYDTIVRLAQPFSMRYMLVDGQGNFGSIDGDEPAAMRYTEIRMATIAKELLTDLDKETVNFYPNYDDTETIPEVLPTKLPNLLANGSSGIAVGMATNIPPHNLNELLTVTLSLLKHPDTSVEELAQQLPGPDFPTGGLIIGRQGIIEAYKTGRGKLQVRAKTEIVQDKQGRETILISELPYQVNKAKLIEKIAELVKEKRIEGIHAIRDESDRDGMSIVLELKKEAVGEIVLNNLFAQTALQTSFGINMVALVQGRPKLLNLKEILLSFIAHRREVVTRRTLFDLKKAQEKAHLMEGLLVALHHLTPVIQCIRTAKTTQEAKASLLNSKWAGFSVQTWLQQVLEGSAGQLHLDTEGNYQFSPVQAQAILDLRLQKLTGLERQKLADEYRTLTSAIQEWSGILEHPDQLTEVIRNELLQLQITYKDRRRTQICDQAIALNLEDLIVPQEVVVTLSHAGYVKYQLLSEYEAQHRGGKGKSASRIKEEDFITQLLVANTHDMLLCFSTKGRLYWIKVYQLPQATRGARGRPIVNLLALTPGERITAILPLSEKTPVQELQSVFMVTRLGTVKKTPLSAFKTPRSSGIIALKLQEDDELIGADLTNGTDEILLFSAQGKAVRFSETGVRQMGRSAMGVRGIQLKPNDYVVSLIVPRQRGEVLTATVNGYGKRSPLEAYPLRSRGTQGVIAIKVTKRNGPVVGALYVSSADELMLITDAATLVRIRVSEINVISRNTQGVTLIKTGAHEKLVGLQRIAEDQVLTHLNTQYPIES